MIFKFYTHLKQILYDLELANKQYLWLISDIEERAYNPFMDKPKLQHPYSEFEIYAFDSSYMFIVSDNRELISKFQKCYPKYEED